MKEPLYLGLDGGGSKTAAVVMDAAEQILGKGEAGPANLASTPISSVEASLVRAATTALHNAGLEAGTAFEAVGAGMAGYVVREQRSALLDLLMGAFTATHYVVQPDYVAAHWGAGGGAPGVCLCAGTGVVAYGKDRGGCEARADGNGFLLGDAGSGFYLGARALRHTLAKIEVGDTSDSLAAAVISATGTPHRDLLVEWVYHPFEPGRIAQLAAVVGRLADNGVPEAQRLLRRAASHLWRSTLRVTTALGGEEDLPLYLLGGLWRISPLLRKYFLECSDIRTSSTRRLVLAEPLHDAATGAALMAAHRSTLHPDDTPRARPSPSSGSK
ncbi:MAG: N-acetylglucosamine kinase [Chthonomonadales bacterium]